MYKVKAESHSHTNVSTHAYSSLEEMVSYCAENGIELLSVTNHGPSLPDAPHMWHFGNMRVLPRIMKNVYILRGVEANVLNTAGEIDMPEYQLEKLDVVIASIHSPLYETKNIEAHTETYLNVIKNKYVDIIGHSGSDEFIYDYERCMPEFKKSGVAVELNNHSFIARKGSEKNCPVIAKLCMEYDVPVVLSSDAHFSGCICGTSNLEPMLEKLNFPERLILNRDADTFLDWLERRKGKRIIEKRLSHRNNL